MEIQYNVFVKQWFCVPDNNPSGLYCQLLDCTKKRHCRYQLCGDHTTDIMNKWYFKRKCRELYKYFLHNISDLNLKFKV